MRKTPTHVAALVIIALAGSASVVAAQSARWSLEGRVNVTVPTGDLSDAGAKSGLGLGADVFYTFIPNMSLYAGLSRHAFNCKGGGCEDVTSTGMDGGVKLLFGAEGRALPWVRGGIMLHKASVGDAKSDLTLGAEAGAGIDVMMAPRFWLVPAVIFHTYPAGLPGGDLDMKYLTISLGAHFHF